MSHFDDLSFGPIYDIIELLFDIYSDGEVDKVAEGLCYESTSNPLFLESKNYTVPSVTPFGHLPNTKFDSFTQAPYQV